MSLAAVGLILGHAAIFGVAFIAAALALASVFFTPTVELKEQGSVEEAPAALVSAD